jgi:hypothetical protein
MLSNYRRTSFFLHFLANIFGRALFKFSQRTGTQHKILRFLTRKLNLFLPFWAIFRTFETKRARKMAQTGETPSEKFVLKFNFAKNEGSEFSSCLNQCNLMFSTFIRVSLYRGKLSNLFLS